MVTNFVAVEALWDSDIIESWKLVRIGVNNLYDEAFSAQFNLFCSFEWIVEATSGRSLKAESSLKTKYLSKAKSPSKTRCLLKAKCSLSAKCSMKAECSSNARCSLRGRRLPQ